MAALPLATRPLTLEDYTRIEFESEERHEFYDGEVFVMSGGTGRHARIVTNVGNQLDRALETTDRVTYGPELRIRVPATSHNRSDLYTYPDASVVCDPPELVAPADTLLNPVLLVEVLSPSTESYDRGLKLELYRQIPTLREFVLVAQSRRAVEVYRRDEGGAWTYHTFTPENGDVELAALGVVLTFDGIYAKTGIEATPPRPPGTPVTGA